MSWLPFRRVLVLLAAASMALPAAARSLEKEQRAVERIRGLSFKSPVTTVEIDRSELPSRIRAEMLKALPYSTEEWEMLLRALLLVDDDSEEPLADLLDLYQSQVLAYYDPRSGTFFSVRQLPEALKDLPAVVPEEAIVVHELTHALQDQHFQIGKKDQRLRHDTDAGLAYHAVLEGEASLVMLAYIIDKMGGSFDEVAGSPVLLEMLGAASVAEFPGAPRYFGEFLKFPYLQGLRFALEAYQRGGWEELSAIHERPPRSTREILHPEEYFERRFNPQPFSGVASPLAGSLALVEHLGEFHWAFLLGAQNAGGWIYDRVTVARNASCDPTVLIETTWESEEAASRFHDAYRRLLESKDIGSLSNLSGRLVKVAYGADLPLMRRFVQ